MPWKVVSESGKFKVYKLDADNKPTGKPLGTHGTRAEAQAQMRALYASEKPKKEAAAPDSAGDVPGAEQAAFPGLDEAITTGHEKDYYEAEEVAMPVGGYFPLGGACSWDDLDAIEEARELQDKMYSMTDKMGMMARNIMQHPGIEDKAQALADLAGEFASRIKNPDTDEKSNEAIAKQITGENQPAHKDTDQDAPGGDSDDLTTTKTHDLFIWKEGDTYRWIAAYSNNRRDSDNPPEIISTESHKEFDQALTKGEWPMPELWLWHIPYPVGITQYHAFDESTGFPVAAGVFNKGCEWAAEGVIAAGWDGVSHGMPSAWLKRNEADGSIIIRHRTKEITFLPTWAAANKLAFNIIQKESIMIDETTKGLPAHKRDEFIKAFGEEKVTQIEATLEATAKEADDSGIEKKEGEAPPETAATPLTPDSEITKALGLMMETITAMRTDFDTRIKAFETVRAEEKEAEPFDLVEFLKSKTIIGQETAKVDGRSTLAKDKPEEAKPESFTQQAGGLRVSLIDDLIAANQAHYQRGTN